MNKLPKRAIAYYRHNGSVGNDKDYNSIIQQQERVLKFAEENGIKIIHEIKDTELSGTTTNRPGLRNLLEQWIMNKDAPGFEYVLLASVCRWGRFQSPDEAAYYEYLCINRNKQVVYADRAFPDGEEARYNLALVLRQGMAREFSLRRSSRIRDGIRRRKIEEQTNAGSYKTRFVLDVEDIQKKFSKKINKGFSVQEERTLFQFRDLLNAKLAVK